MLVWDIRQVTNTGARTSLSMSYCSTASILIHMKFARYWTRDQGEEVGPDGERIQIVARGWSDESMDAARARARDIAQRVAQRLITDPDSRSQYEYGTRPLPEPKIREFGGSGDGSSAVVTRNAYGALVLNTAGMMFVDV